MSIPDEWITPADLAAAKRAQGEMAERVETTDRLPDIRILGGTDVSASRFDPTRRVWAALVTLDATTLAIDESATEARLARFPYIPGYLGFRGIWYQTQVEPLPARRVNGARHAQGAASLARQGRPGGAPPHPHPKCCAKKRSVRSCARSASACE